MLDRSTFPDFFGANAVSVDCYEETYERLTASRRHVPRKSAGVICDSRSCRYLIVRYSALIDGVDGHRRGKSVSKPKIPPECSGLKRGGTVEAISRYETLRSKQGYGKYLFLFSLPQAGFVTIHG